jgi:DNA-binding NtrC family response regulator
MAESDVQAARVTRAITPGRELRFHRIRLAVTDGPDRGQSATGGAGDLSVGTAPGNDLVLGDSTVSRHHFAIGPTPRGHQIRDLGSTNGTIVNGVAIESAFLRPGAVIAVGETRLRFEHLDDEVCEPLSAEGRWGAALGTSDAMRRIFVVLPRIADADATVLIEGETGTGKSMLAQAIHDASPRRAGPFVTVDCGSIPPTLIESELFGHEKGAFTGATAPRIGAFESARGGTVFLDEIGELPLDMQPKLLRALDGQSIKPIGGNQTVRLDVRVIAATNRDLRAEVNRNRFRSDLFYRLATVRLRIPPLRERVDDIPLLAAHFYAQFSPGDPEPPASLLADLIRQDWHGNVRELRSAVERAVLLGDPTLWREIAGGAPMQPTGDDPDAILGTAESFRAAKELAVGAGERAYITALVEKYDRNLSRAARAVRMDRNHLRELLRRYGVTIREGD